MSGVVNAVKKPITGGVSLLKDVSGYNLQKQSLELAQQASRMASQPRSTPFSSVNPGTGYTSIDPSIRALRESTLANLPGYRSALDASLSGYSSGVNDYLARTRGYMNDLESGMNPYIQARVNPLLERAAAGRGQLTQSLSNRGLGGSSWAAQSLASYDTATSREEAAQRAQAAMETLASRDALSRSMLEAQGALTAQQQGTVGAQQQIDQQAMQVAAANLQQELSALGLSAPDIQAILGSSQMIGNVAQQRMEFLGRLLSSAGNAAKAGAG